MVRRLLLLVYFLHRFFKLIFVPSGNSIESSAKLDFSISLMIFLISEYSIFYSFMLVLKTNISSLLTYVSLSKKLTQTFYLSLCQFAPSPLTFFNRITLLCPPNPKESDIAYFIFSFLPLFGTTSRSHSSSGTL